MTNLPGLQLPAHLQKLQSSSALMAANVALSAGISSGGWPRISIKSSRFRLQAPAVDEVILSTFHMDVIVIEGNPTLSKTYYKAAYNSEEEDVAPDCYSDNGVAPSQQAKNPQCSTCAACPHNVWGSKISQMTGKQIKACADSKKIAVFIADNTGGSVYEFRIPPASLKNWLAYVDLLTKAGIAACSVITRVSFDPDQVGILLFEPAGLKQTGNVPYITEEQAEDLMAVVGTDEVTICIGTKDKPIDANRVVAAATTMIAQQTSLPPVPAPAAPQALLQHPPAPPMQATEPALAKPPEAPKRTRRTKAEMQNTPSAGAENIAAIRSEQGLSINNPVPPFLRDTSLGQQQIILPPTPLVNNASNVAPLNPPVANAALADLLAKAMAT